jgi:LAS superfamily LD-carboxypeptidase LdcB
MSCVEMRTPVSVFGSLPSDSPLLVDVPTTLGHPQQRLHVLAAAAAEPMDAAIRADLGIEARTASGWRPKRFQTWDEYVAYVTTRYGSLERGRMFLAFESPHQTGLARDFGCGGLSPTSTTIEAQKKTPLYLWLCDNAWKYGWHPYKVEPWHWERWVDLPSYLAGKDTHSDDSGPVTTCSNANDVCIEAPLDEILSPLR